MYFIKFVTELYEMAKICILIALLSQLFYTFVQGQRSPCPQYFTYIIEPGTDETIGFIEIQSPPKIGELHLTVKLKVAAELPSVSIIFFTLLIIKNKIHYKLFNMI